MIPDDLKTGTRVRCVDADGSYLSTGRIYTVAGYAEGYLKLVETGGLGSSGWYLDRFEVAANADGSDYQAEDGVDLC